MATQPLSLPKPKIPAGPSLEQTLAQRRSHRTFSTESISLDDLARLLWAGQGRTGDYDGRASPSAGGLHPLQLHVAAGLVSDLDPGLYRYDVDTHALQVLASGDMRTDLRQATANQECLGEGAADIVIGADPAATLDRYGKRGYRYLHMEAGHVAQNICLQATALGLVATTVAAFDDDDMAKAARFDEGVLALYAIPVGHRR